MNKDASASLGIALTLIIQKVKGTTKYSKYNNRKKRKPKN